MCNTSVIKKGINYIIFIVRFIHTHTLKETARNLIQFKHHSSFTTFLQRELHIKLKQLSEYFRDSDVHCTFQCANPIFSNFFFFFYFYFLHLLKFSIDICMMLKAIEMDLWLDYRSKNQWISVDHIIFINPRKNMKSFSNWMSKFWLQKHQLIWGSIFNFSIQLKSSLYAEIKSVTIQNNVCGK